MSDIVEWLRETTNLGAHHPHLAGYVKRHNEAADEIERLRGEIADWESHWNSHETELKTEIERLQKKLWEVAPMCCHDCGEVHVRIDEDGCCAYCGGSTYQGIEKRIGEES